jgi:hypothetical protein
MHAGSLKRSHQEAGLRAVICPFQCTGQVATELSDCLLPDSPRLLYKFLFSPGSRWVSLKLLWLCLVSSSTNKIGQLSVVPYPQSWEFKAHQSAMTPLREVPLLIASHLWVGILTLPSLSEVGSAFPPVPARLRWIMFCQWHLFFFRWCGGALIYPWDALDYVPWRAGSVCCLPAEVAESHRWCWVQAGGESSLAGPAGSFSQGRCMADSCGGPEWRPGQ